MEEFEMKKKHLAMICSMFCIFLLGCTDQKEMEATIEDSQQVVQEVSTEEDTKESTEENTEMQNSTNPYKTVLITDETEIDKEVVKYIDQYVELTDETAVEQYTWVRRDGGDILQIGVRYQDAEPGTIQGHKEDYFIFLNKESDTQQVLYVDYEGKFIGEACSYIAHFEDVTFDGNEDLLIHLGYTSHAVYYCAYIFEDGEYRYEKTFEHIPSYEVDQENQVIHGSDTDGLGWIYEATYQYENGHFVTVEENEYMISE